MEQNYYPDGQDAAWRNLVLKQLETVSNDVANVKSEIHNFQLHIHSFELQVTKDITKLSESMLPRQTASDVESLKEWRRAVEKDLDEAKREAMDWRKSTDEKIKKHEKYFTIIITILVILETILKYGDNLARVVAH